MENCALLQGQVNCVCHCHHSIQLNPLHTFFRSSRPTGRGVTAKVSTPSTSCRWPAFDCPSLAITDQVVINCYRVVVQSGTVESLNSSTRELPCDR